MLAPFCAGAIIASISARKVESALSFALRKTSTASLNRYCLISESVRAFNAGMSTPRESAGPVTAPAETQRHQAAATAKTRMYDFNSFIIAVQI